MSLVTKRWSGRSLNKTANGWSYTDGYDVTGVTDEEQAMQALEDAYPVTIHNEVSDLSDFMYCESKRAEVTGFNFWTITVTYSSSPAGRHFNHGAPLDEPTKWRVVIATEQYSSPTDAYGKAVLNAAGQAFASDPPGYERSITLVGQRTAPFFDLARALAYTNAVNDTPLTFDNNWTLEKGQACCRGINCLTTVTGHEPYIIEETVIELREGFTLDSDGYRDGFKLRILNEGTEGWYPSGDNTRARGPLCRLRVDPQTKQNVPDKVSSPVLLDNQGRPTGEGIYVMCPKEVDTRGYTDPLGNPVIQSQIVFEDTDDATFIKIFPAGTKFKNLADLGL